MVSLKWDRRYEHVFPRDYVPLVVTGPHAHTVQSFESYVSYEESALTHTRAAPSKQGYVFSPGSST